MDMAAVSLTLPFYLCEQQRKWASPLRSEKKDTRQLEMPQNSLSAFTPSPLSDLAASWHGQDVKLILPHQFWEGKRGQGLRREEKPSMSLPPRLESAHIMCANTWALWDLPRPDVHVGIVGDAENLQAVRPRAPNHRPPGEGSRGPRIAMAVARDGRL